MSERDRLCWGVRAVRCALGLGAASLVVWATASVASVGSPRVSDQVLSSLASRDEASGAILDRLPPSFEERLFELPEHSDLRVDESAGVVGFAMEGGRDDALALIADLMGASGWACFDAGVPGAASFVRESEVAFVSCVDVGDATTVVVQAPFLSSVTSPGVEGEG